MSPEKFKDLCVHWCSYRKWPNIYDTVDYFASFRSRTRSQHGHHSFLLETTSFLPEETTSVCQTVSGLARNIQINSLLVPEGFPDEEGSLTWSTCDMGSSFNIHFSGPICTSSLLNAEDKKMIETLSLHSSRKKSRSFTIRIYKYLCFCDIIFFSPYNHCEVLSPHFMAEKPEVQRR